MLRRSPSPPPSVARGREGRPETPGPAWRSRLRRWLPRPHGLGVLLFICGAACLLLVMAVFGGQGVFKIRQLQRDRALLEEKISAAEAQVTELRRRHEDYRAGTASYEKSAREKLGLVRPGEVVYDFRPDPLADRP